MGQHQSRRCPRAKVLLVGQDGNCGVGDHGAKGRSSERERILEQLQGMGEPGTGCCWIVGKTGLFSSLKPLEIAKQGEIMQNILQKDPCP